MKRQYPLIYFFSCFLFLFYSTASAEPPKGSMPLAEVSEESRIKESDLIDALRDLDKLCSPTSIICKGGGAILPPTKIPDVPENRDEQSIWRWICLRYPRLCDEEVSRERGRVSADF